MSVQVKHADILIRCARKLFIPSSSEKTLLSMLNFAISGKGSISYYYPSYFNLTVFSDGRELPFLKRVDTAFHCGETSGDGFYSRRCIRVLQLQCPGLERGTYF